MAYFIAFILGITVGEIVLFILLFILDEGKEGKELTELGRIENKYQVKIVIKFHEKMERYVWETKYKESTVYADNLENLETALRCLRDSEV